MNNSQFIEITDKMDEIDTFESYTTNFYLYKNDFIMPLVNLLLIDNEIDNIPNRRVEFAYVLLKNTAQIDWIGQDTLKKTSIGRKKITNTKAALTDWFTYNTIDEEYELKVNFDEMWLFIPNKARISDKWFAPFSTPKYLKNVNQNDLDDFENLNMLENNTGIITQIKDKFVFYSSNETEWKNIEENWTKEYK